MTSKPKDTRALEALIHKQIEGGCKGWNVDVVRGSAKLVLERHQLYLQNPQPGSAAPSRLVRVKGVLDVVDYVCRMGGLARAQGDRVVVDPWHTDHDDRVSLCVECNDRPGEARVSGKWVCGVCVPLTDMLTA